MANHVKGGGGCFLALTVIFLGPGLIAAAVLHSAVWLLLMPVLSVISWVALAKWGPKRQLTPEQLADELESHLLSSGGPWDWDDTTSLTIANERSEVFRGKLSKFDSLALDEKRNRVYRNHRDA